MTSSDIKQEYKNLTNNSFTNLIGKKFGLLTVVSFNEKQNIKKIWKCICDCGESKNITNKGLVSGKTKNCGKSIHDFKRKPYGESSFNRLFGAYKDQGKNRNLEFSLRKEEFAKLTKQNCHYCGRSPLSRMNSKNFNGEYTYNGIDRMDNKKGYTTENSLTCCVVCNLMKRNLSYDDFLKKIELIFNNRIGIYENII